MKCKMYWRCLWRFWQRTGVVIKDVVGSKPKMHSYVVEDSSELKKTNRNK